MNIDDLLGYARRTGMFWSTADIYGGASGLYDYGHIGAMLKRNFESQWLSYFVERNSNYYLIDASTLLPEKPLVASGHAERFNDVLIGCRKCKSYYRADMMLSEAGVEVREGASPADIDEIVLKNGVKCPKCGGDFGPSKVFNMMIDVSLGPEKSDKGYLRPETAQSTFLNFYREFNTLRQRLPLGLALIGRAYRNEISPRQGLYRLRELIQAELQVFFDEQNFHPDISPFQSDEVNVVPYSTGKQVRVKVNDMLTMGYPDFYVYHAALIHRFYTKILGYPEDKFRLFEKGGDDKAFYNKVHMDIELDVESWGGFKEVGGLHYRGDYDLTSHSKGSSKKLSVKIEGREFTPHVLELSFGVDRNIWALVDIMYSNESGRQVLSLQPWLSPYNAAIFPLQSDPKIDEEVAKLHSDLSRKFRIFLDVSGSIGKRYARMDEVGTPFCITVDYDTVNPESEDYGKVTVRKRDSREQERVRTADLEKYLFRALQPDF